MTQTTASKPEKKHFRNRMKRVPVLLFALIVDLYGIFTLILLLAAIVFGETLVSTNLYISLLPGLLYPLFPIVLCSLLLRRWRSIVFNLPGVLAFLLLYGGMFLPVTQPDTVPDLTVMSFNIMYNTPDFQDTADVIRHSGADIVALQEVNPDAKALFEKSLIDIYPYQVYIVDAEYGVEKRGALSRYPILDSQAGTGKVRRLLYQRLLFDVNGQKLLIYNTHAPTPATSSAEFRSDFRRWDMDILLEDASAEDLPVILMGDFNMTDASDDYRFVRSYYTDAFAESGWGFGTTFPSFSTSPPGTLLSLPVFKSLPPLIRLDYIFVDDAFRPLHAEVIYQGNSDHFPVKTGLIWRD